MFLPGKGNHSGSCLVVAQGMTHWFTAAPNLPISVNSLVSPPLSFHLSWGCFTPPSQRPFCCQSWQDWQRVHRYGSAWTCPGPWIWAKLGLPVHMAETHPISISLALDLHAGDDTQGDVMSRSVALGSLQLTDLKDCVNCFMWMSLTGSIQVYICPNA